MYGHPCWNAPNHHQFHSTGTALNELDGSHGMRENQRDACHLQQAPAIAQRIEAVAEPMWEARPAAETADGTPALESFFFVATPGNSFVGAAAVDPDRVGETIPLLSRPIFAEPGTFGFMTQPLLFGRGADSGIVVSILATDAGQITINIGRAFTSQDAVPANIRHNLSRINSFFKNFNIFIDKFAPATFYLYPFYTCHNYLLHTR